MRETQRDEVVGETAQQATHEAAGPTPYPEEPSPSQAGAASNDALYECQVCGSTFTLRESADGAELPDVNAFLALHRKCVRRLLTHGGSFARQSPRRRTK